MWRNDLRQLHNVTKVPYYGASLQNILLVFDDLSSDRPIYPFARKVEILTSRFSHIMVHKKMNDFFSPDDFSDFKKKWKDNRKSPKGYCEPIGIALERSKFPEDTYEYYREILNQQTETLQLAAKTEIEASIKKRLLIGVDSTLLPLFRILKHCGNKYKIFENMCLDYSAPPMFKPF
jgi:hypothetical protein